MEEKSILWRIQLAVVLTSLGVLYYFVFLFFLCAGVPIERIHYFMTDGWPNFCADNVPLVAPTFLIVGLGLGWSYNMKKKPKSAPEPEYQFQFKSVEKKQDLALDPDDYVFSSKAIKKTVEYSSKIPKDHDEQ
jgi:hypothetical protein